MSLEKLTQDLSSHFNQKDYATCQQLLTPIRLELIKNGLLVPSSDRKIDANDTAITRSILEIGALSSINLKNTSEFLNYIALLRPFYLLKPSAVPESAKKNELLSLYLLLLLTQGDLALFHVELDRFQEFGKSVDQLEDDKYLSIPIKFEKWIIDGDFSKVYETLSSKHRFPCKEFNLFEDDLLNSIRLNIAENLQAAYQSLPLENLKMLLFVRSNEEAAQVMENFDWSVSNGTVYFTKSTNDLADEITDEKQIIKNGLAYAKEMESII